MEANTVQEITIKIPEIKFSLVPNINDENNE
jgi:hypothetical protein